MATSISATQAARSFSDILARVRYRGEEFLIEKGGEPVCRLTPVRVAARTARQLASIIGSLPKPDAQYLKEVERVSKRQPKVPKSRWGR